jgi:hypothetical protein
LFEGRGRPFALAFGAGFLDLSFTTFLDAALDLGLVLAFDFFEFLRTAILISQLSPFVPAEAGIQRFALGFWVPAFAGTNGSMLSAFGC